MNDPVSASPSERAPAAPAEAPTWPEVDRRITPDRRGAPTSFWEALAGRGRRRRGRRKGEAQNIYVEIYGRREVLLVLAVLILNVLDALLTLDYLEKGGFEANPVARGLLDMGDGWFLAAKTFLIGVCLLFLLVHQTFIHVRTALYILCSFYGLLFLYHLFLQARFFLVT
ncbi:MAG: DUF5658 family protein [Planctomycetota bacterium]